MTERNTAWDTVLDMLLDDTPVEGYGIDMHPWRGDEAAELRRCMEHIADVGLLDFFLEGNIKTIFCFRHEDNPQESTNVDGEWWGQVRENGSERRGIIGISVAAIQRGQDYTVGVLLHEAAHAHAGDGGHDARFHNLLDEMLMYYNQRAGKALENDYQFLPEEDRDKLALRQDAAAPAQSKSTGKASSSPVTVQNARQKYAAIQRRYGRK